MSESVKQNYGSAAGRARESAEKSMKAGQAAAERAAEAGKDAAKTTLAAGSEAVTKAYDQAFGMARDAVQKSFPQAAAQFDEFAGFQRANVAAAVAAGSAAMKGVETLSSEVLAFNARVMEDGVASVEKLLACRSVPDMLQTQTQCAVAQLQQMLTYGSRMTDLAIKMAGDVVTPVQQRLGQAADRFGTSPNV